ncbi:GtrA family protein [uncultured Deefgea sp.]|uniref:GtrA family protein n=1 Tax=uncultured Deefgea sp. TaxID=1304914 RepID=UPI0035B54144
MPNKIREKRNFFVFVVGGIINTILTYLLYLVFILFLNYQLAYAVTYIAGIGFAYWFNCRYVFQRKVSFKTFIKFPLVYCVQYAVGALLMFFSVGFFNLSEVLAPIVTSVITIPLTFLLSKIVLAK